MHFPKPYILILLYALASCRLTEKNIAGKYSDYYNFENSAELTLKGDKTFDYFLQSGMTSTYKGKWRLSKDTLILYSISKPASPKFISQQVSVSNESLVRIFVNDELNTPVPFEFYLNDKKNYVFDTLVISYTSLRDTFSIYTFSYKPVLLNKTDIKPGLLQIKVFRNPDDYFEDIKFLISNKKLKELSNQKQTGLILRPS